MEEGWVKWKLKHERPEKVPGCQDTRQLHKLEPGDTDCLNEKCFYYTCQTCSAQLALDIFNPNYEENLHVIPTLSCIKQPDLFTEDNGYHVEVIEFYANCLERSKFKGIAVNGGSNVHARNPFDNVEATLELKNQSKTKPLPTLEDDLSKKVTDWKKHVSAKCKNNSLSLQICREKNLNSEHKNRPKIDPILLDLKRDLGCKMTRWNKHIRDKLNKQPPLPRSYNEKGAKSQRGSNSKIEKEKTKEDGGSQGKQEGSNESTQLNNISKIRRSHSLPGYWKQKITLETKHLKSEGRKIMKTKKGKVTSESRQEVKDFELDWILFDGISTTVVEVGEVGEEPDKKKGREKNCEKKQQMGKIKKCNDAKDCEMKKQSIVGDKLKQIKRDAIVIRHLLEATGSSDVPVNYLAVFPNLTIGEIERSEFLQRNKKTCVHAVDSALVEEEVPTQVILVRSDKDLLLRTTINKYGKKIEFKAADNYNGFTGKIAVTFPPCSVLGEEKVSLEIVPESLVHAYNETSEKLKSGVPEIITPILHLDRENDTSFLRDVELSFPVFPKFFNILAKCQSSDKLLLENRKILLRESKFSPKAVCYDDVEGILGALRVDTHFSLAFKKPGVYLLVEQFPKNEFVFDLRPFVNEEEHRLYRMDEKKTFRMIVNPQLTDPSIYGTRVSIIVQEPAVLRNIQHFRNVRGNKINFTFPDLECDIDCTNERRVTVVTKHESLKFFRVQFHFESSLLEEKKGIDGTIKIPLYSEQELTKFTTRRFVQNKGMLLEFLKLLDSNWSIFLAVYLGVEMRNMKEFIGEDIRLSLPSSVLNWSEDIKRQLKMETDAREFQEVSCREQLVETMLKNYQSSTELFKAKAEIIEILKIAEVLASDTKYSQGLHLESREILASALMYVPVTQLRKAMRDCYDQRKLFSLTPDVDKFIYDGDLPEGEGPQENRC